MNIYEFYKLKTLVTIIASWNKNNKILCELIVNLEACVSGWLILWDVSPC